MTTFASFNIKSRSKLFEIPVNCEHNLPKNEWEYCSFILNDLKVKKGFEEPINRIRLFSPSKRATDVKELWKQASKYRETMGDKSSSDKDTNDELKSIKMVDPKHLEAMK